MCGENSPGRHEMKQPQFKGERGLELGLFSFTLRHAQDKPFDKLRTGNSAAQL
jgi:hypothetical protein